MNQAAVIFRSTNRIYVLAWLDHFDNVVGHHQWSDDRKALELRTTLENVEATWFIQQLKEVK